MDERYAMRLGELRAMDREAAVTLEATRMLCGDVQLRAQLEQARADHERHVREIDALLTRAGEDPDAVSERSLSPSVLGLMQRARESAPGEAAERLAVVERVVGDRYQQFLQGGDVPAEAEGLMRSHIDDEIRHEHDLVEADTGRCPR